MFLPGRIRERKLDKILTYALGTSIWALLHLWFYEFKHPFYQPDDCFHKEHNILQSLLPHLTSFSMNLGLALVATCMVEGVTSISLTSKEVKSKMRKTGVGGVSFPCPGDVP